jgi:hypothetical protein
MSDLDFLQPAVVRRDSGIRTERHTRMVGDRVRCLDTGEVGVIHSYDLSGDYLIDTGREGGYLRRLDDTELVSV